MIFQNDFHNTKAIAYPREGWLSMHQLRRLDRKLCTGRTERRVLLRNRPRPCIPAHIGRMRGQ